MNNRNYETISSLFKINKDRKKRKRLFILIFTCTILFLAYLITSISALYIDDKIMKNIFLKSSEIVEIAVSIIVSLTALIIGNFYNDETERLMNDIIDRNKSLNITLPVDKKKCNIVKVLFDIDFIVLFCLFFLNSFFKLITFFKVKICDFQNITFYLTIALNVCLIILNVLSIIDCINSSKKYKATISKIEKINNQLFEMYNRNMVDSHR